VLERFREEVKRLGASGALTPPPSAPCSEVSDYEAGEDWDEDDWADEEAEGDEEEHPELTTPLTVAQFTTGAAVAAALAGHHPFDAADVAVEATLHAATLGRAASPCGFRSDELPYEDAAQAQQEHAAAAAVRMDALSLRVAESESEADASRERLHRALHAVGLEPRATSQELAAHAQAARDAAVAAAREAAEASGQAVSRRPRTFSATALAEQIDEDDGLRSVHAPMFTRIGGAASTLEAASTAAAAATARLRTMGVDVPLPALASALDEYVQAPGDSRRVRPGGLMMPPEEPTGQRDREHIDRRENEALSSKVNLRLC